MDNLNFKHLKYFWTVAKTGSIARASEQLHLTPQSISGQLTEFEERLGVELFRRAGRGLELAWRADAAREAKQAANQEQEAPAQDTAEIMQQAVTLPQRVALYVPGTQGADTATDNAAQVERVAAEFSRMFGGATAQESTGFWMSDTAGLVRETVTIVYANCTADQLRDRLPDVLTLAQQIKAEMQQEAVTITIDQKMYII